MFRFRRGISRRRGRTTLAALAALGVAIGSLGIPLPAIVVKTSSRPFPCQNHPCGCVDADSCWRDCCCFTREEKLAWARRNGVTPPKEILLAANVAAARGAKASSCGHACCAAAKSPDHGEAAGAVASSSRELTMVHVIAAMRCRGVSVSVTLLPPSLPVERCQFSLPLAESFERARPEPLLYEPPILAIATPPPDVCWL